MHIIFEIIGLVFLAAISIALLGAVLLVFGVVGLYQTHSPVFLVPTVLGLLLASALD
jgi:hypothetical protein